MCQAGNIFEFSLVKGRLVQNVKIAWLKIADTYWSEPTELITVWQILIPRSWRMGAVRVRKYKGQSTWWYHQLQ